MMIAKLALPAVLAAALSLGVVRAADAGQSPGKHAKISMSAARAIALRAVPGGTITDAQFEKEPGGSGARYSFNVKIKGETREIGVDAKTGKILENSLEGVKPD